MSEEFLKKIQPNGWKSPRGYSNGMLGRGDVLFIAGQIAWDAQCNLVSQDFAQQFGQCVANVIAVLEAAGGRPEHLARMTVYVTDLDEYRASSAEIGRMWREKLGRHYPAMALVRVAGLLEPGAKVEIEATAILPVPTD
jgi:enamine deaminase RidA (YjgF/YER057c/UK114 family)